MALKEKYTCTKCGYSLTIEHFGETDGDALRDFLEHLSRCGSVKIEPMTEVT